MFCIPRLLRSLSLFSIFALFWASFVFAKTQEEIAAGIDRVQRQVFAELIRYAESTQTQVYVAGSTVAKMAVAVSEGTAPDPAHLSDFVSSGQDIDLTVGGGNGQKKRLELWLKENLPQYEWDLGTRKSLETPEFRDQNSDSLSTVSLLVSSKPGGSVLLDFHRQDLNPALFLSDVANHQIHFYVSSRHRETAWAQKGKNPEVFSVIRYLTNIAKYGAKPVPEDIETINGLIRDFDYSLDIRTEYGSRRLGDLYDKFDRYRDRLKALLASEDGGLNVDGLIGKVRGMGCSMASVLGSLVNHE